MKEIYKNYYKQCRENANLSQEQAAELLHVSIRSLSDYENGKTIPPDEVVEMMITIYHTKLLGWLHLRNTSSLAMKCIPEVEKIKSEADIFLHIVFSEDGISEIKTKIKEILEDGKITPDEQSDFEKIQQQARNMIGRLFSIAAYELNFK